MDMPSALASGTEVSFAPSAVFACVPSVCSCGSSVFAWGSSVPCCTGSVFACARSFNLCAVAVLFCAASASLACWVLGLSAASATQLVSNSANNRCRLMASPFCLCGCEGRRSIFGRQCYPERAGCMPRNGPARTGSPRDTGRTEWQDFCAHNENQQTVLELLRN